MADINSHAIQELVASAIGNDCAQRAVALLEVDPRLLRHGEDGITRAQFSMALNVCLFDDLLTRVPMGKAYVTDCQRADRKVLFDHGALRTIDGRTGSLPGGYPAFSRILEPLGYGLVGLYPLDRLRMTGRAYAHLDLPESIPQFFVSELHVDRLSGPVRAASDRIFGQSRDPIGPLEQSALDGFARSGTVALDFAVAALPGILRAFGRQHPHPALSDYETLLAESSEAAWIATEGNAFNHATDRVPDVEVVAASQRALSRPVKDTIEISTNGRVRQTAFRADPVKRQFVLADGFEIVRQVPGSFFEFISRDCDPSTGALDLRFDSGNAQGIFAMTKAS